MLLYMWVINMSEIKTGRGYVYSIQYHIVWCVKYIFIPLGVAITARCIADKLLRPQPDKQRKKRSSKNRF